MLRGIMRSRVPDHTLQALTELAFSKVIRLNVKRTVIIDDVLHECSIGTMVLDPECADTRRGYSLRRGLTPMSCTDQGDAIRVL